MTKKKVYISLPISGYDIEAVKDRAGRAAKYLQDKGYEPITPFDVSPDNEATYAAHMGKDIHALLECDAVFFLYGWWNSKGCQLERMAAMIYGKEMMHDVSKGSVEFERVLPYPPFMKGDIVTYNDCLSTKAVYSDTTAVKNDSGDDCFISHMAFTEKGIYHGNMVFAEDIRLATPREVFDFICKIDFDMRMMKSRLSEAEAAIDAYRKGPVVSPSEMEQTPHSYVCGIRSCEYRVPSGDKADCGLQGCQRRFPYPFGLKGEAVVPDTGVVPLENTGAGCVSDQCVSSIGSAALAKEKRYVVGFDPAMGSENEG